MLTKPIAFLCCFVPLCFFSQVKDSAAFFGSYSIYPYYLPLQDPSPYHDFYTVKKIYHRHIDSLGNASHFNGIITITFFINYEGKAAFFSTRAVNNNYIPVTIPENTNDPLRRLSNVILNTTTQYFSTWMACVDRQGAPMNARKFYSFRFSDGVLSEIFPK